jgi:hypothetical protein
MGTASEPMDLERERQYFEGHRSELVDKYNNLFVLIKGDQLISAFPTAEAAYEAGIEKFEMEPFLVKQVLPEEPISSVHIVTTSPSHANPEPAFS